MSKIILKKVTLDYPILGVDDLSFKKTFMTKTVGGIINSDLKKRVFVRAIDNISLNINDGEKIGIYGSNGSGKSSLLRLIAGIFEPTFGEVIVEGSINSLLSISFGLEDHLSGIENIKFRLKLKNLNSNNQNKLLNEIVDFVNLGNFLYLPIKTYSSGMRLRLAFALAILVQANIILMDEWLSVGDENFNKLAQIKIQKLIKDSSIFIICSQNKQILETICDKIIILDKGKILYEK